MPLYCSFDMQGASISGHHTSIWRSDTSIWWLFFTSYYLMAPFLNMLAPKTSLQGPLWPSSKILWLKHWLVPLYIVNNYCVLRMVKAKKENKNIQQRTLLSFITIPSINDAYMLPRLSFFWSHHWLDWYFLVFQLVLEECHTHPSLPYLETESSIKT